MARRKSAAVIGSVAAFVLLIAGCANDAEPSSTTSSTAPSSSAVTHHQNPAGEQSARPGVGNGGGAVPTKTVTQHPGPARATTNATPTKPLAPGNGGTYDVPCTGPDQGTVCTNPNHGAGTVPGENGGDGSASAPEQRDDDPGGKPCTTGNGDSGTYVYSDDTNGWVCQIG